jgi:hypothetical protein
MARSFLSRNQRFFIVITKALVESNARSYEDGDDSSIFTKQSFDELSNS